MSTSVKTFLAIGVILLTAFGYWYLTSSGGSASKRTLISNNNRVVSKASTEPKDKEEEKQEMTKRRAYEQRLKDEAKDKAEFDYAVENQKPQKLAESVTKAMRSPYEKKLDDLKQNRTTIPSYNGKQFVETEETTTNESLTKTQPKKKPIAVYKSSVPTNRKSELTETTSEAVKTEDPFNTTSFAQQPVVVENSKTTASNNIAASPLAVKASVFGDQTVKAGSLVKFRLMEDAVIDGTNFPRNTVFNGRCTFGPERVFVTVDKLPIKGAGFATLKMTVQDQDLQDGLYAPIDPGKASAVDATTSSVETVVSNIGTPGMRVGTGMARIFRSAVNGQLKVDIADGYPVNFLIASKPTKQ